MRTHHRSSRTPIAGRRHRALLLVGAALLVLSPSAAAQELPDAVDDPVAAVEPLEPRPEPVAPEPAPRPDADPQPGPAPTNPRPGVAVVAGIADPAPRPAAPSAAVAGAAAAPAETPVPTGSLPFTGPDRGQIVLALLVGSLLVASGLVAVAYGRVADEAA